MSSQNRYRYLPYEAKDERYFGCRSVLEAEWEYIEQRRAYYAAKDEGANTMAHDPKQAPETGNTTSHTDAPQGGKKGTRVSWWARISAILFGTNIKTVCDEPQVGAQSTTAEPKQQPIDLSGIALSGGGIRSASFSLGILQALSYAGWLKKLDYLSTVSGGGYIGGSLSWLLHKEWHGPNGAAIPYGLERRNFPFGSYPMVGMEDKKEQGKKQSTEKPESAEWNVYKGRMLRYLRQHARYLTPGDGINFMSLAAVTLRNTLFSLFVYGGALVLIFMLMWPFTFEPANTLGIFKHVGAPLSALFNNLNRAHLLAAGLCMVLLIAAVIYALRTMLSRRRNSGYRLRFFFERWMGRILTLTLLCAVIGFIPSVNDWINKAGRTATPVTAISLSGSSEKLGSISLLGEIKQSKDGAALATGASVRRPEPEWSFDKLKAALTGVFAALLSAISSVLAFMQEGKQKKKIPTSVFVAIASFGLIFGLLLLAYFFAGILRPIALLKTGWLWALLGIFVVFLRWPNLNYLSIHRYYRDRLMETFTPDLPDAIHVNGAVPGALKSADSTPLNEMINRNHKGPLAHYPIINSNIVLVSSDIPKFRGRGGDNFILTPMFCGSNATGWCETQHSPYANMTLPTAMAISGAAVNSNTGSGGNGLTRAPWLSFLMGFFNIRIGYWADNPTPKWERLCRIAQAEQRQFEKQDTCGYPALHVLLDLWDRLFEVWRRCLSFIKMLFQSLLSLPLFADLSKPNALYPGMFEMFLRKNLNENSRMVQLSDGGHFENLGLYELVRRRLKLIIVCDGSADAQYGFEDLANAMEKVRADFGALVTFDNASMEKLTPKSVIETGEEAGKKVSYADQGYLIGRVIYNDREQATLIYITTSFFQGLSADLYAYRKAHPEFPDEPTSDQFFDEKQFEAYRELGYQTAYRMMHDRELLRTFDVRRILGEPDFGKHEE